MIACTATVHAKSRVRAEYASHETINSKRKASDKLEKKCTWVIAKRSLFEVNFDWEN